MSEQGVGPVERKRKRGVKESEAAQPGGNGAMTVPINGVIDGSFDGGYLVRVKIGETDTVMRGVVFPTENLLPPYAQNNLPPLLTYRRRFHKFYPMNPNP